MNETATVYQIKIALPGIDPPVWRRLEVPGDMTFAALHQAIQKAMGWEDYHLWAFYVDKTELAPPQPAEFDFPGAPRPLQAARKTLDEMLARRRIKFRYIYDMGDDWLHEIKVEKILAPEPGAQYPRCTGGERACPPEDCGGIWGYQNFLEAVADPKHPEHEAMLEWIGDEWNPEAFNLDAVNAALKPRGRKSGKAAKRK